MNDAYQFLVRYDVACLFAAVFVDQIGVPLPAVPWLLAAGALTVTGQMSLSAAFSATILGAIFADLIWFYLGRRFGKSAPGLLCRLSADPDACVCRTQSLFTKHGMAGVVVSKFIPVMKTLVPALAGSSGVSASRFLFFDGLGSLLFAGVFILTGSLFSAQVDYILEMIGRHGGKTLGSLAGLSLAYIAYHSFRRRRLLSKARRVGSAVDKLRHEQEASEKLFIGQ
jgi:membrane protein DedA with SNARE-associated domain